MTPRRAGNTGPIGVLMSFLGGDQAITTDTATKERCPLRADGSGCKCALRGRVGRSDYRRYGFLPVWWAGNLGSRWEARAPGFDGNLYTDLYGYSNTGPSGVLLPLQPGHRCHSICALR